MTYVSEPASLYRRPSAQTKLLLTSPGLALLGAQLLLEGVEEEPAPALSVSSLGSASLAQYLLAILCVAASYCLSLLLSWFCLIGRQVTCRRSPRFGLCLSVMVNRRYGLVFGSPG